MVGRYKRKSERQQWREEDMKSAIQAIEKKEMGWLAAAKKFNVPQATLRRRYQGVNKRVKGIEKGLGRFGTTFSWTIERQLVEYLKKVEVQFYGLTTKELRHLVYEFAERNKLEHRFNKEKRIAGWDWLYGFRNRHPDISLRQPEPTSIARATAFNKVQVQKFFDILESTIEEFNITPERIYNMDESGLSTVQRPSKIFATKGRKQVGAVTSAERGVHTTAVCCMNAIGSFIPPAMIFARKNAKAELTDDAPTGTLQLCQDSGWMTGPLFLKWLTHFVHYSNTTVEKKLY